MRYHHEYRGLGEDAKLQRKEFASRVHQVHSVASYLGSQIHYRVWWMSGGMALAGPRICRGWTACWVLSAGTMPLCITENDVHEKNHQVKLMQTIYTKAFAVVIWLGEGTEDGAKAIEFVSSISHCAPWQKEEAWGENEIACFPWLALIEFFLLAYWRRLWIIQELALNHHMSIFFCGEGQVSRRMILHTSEFYQRNSLMIDGFLSNTSKNSLVSGPKEAP